MLLKKTFRFCLYGYDLWLCKDFVITFYLGLNEIPEDEWYCSSCRNALDLPRRPRRPPSTAATDMRHTNVCRGNEQNEEEEEEEDDDDDDNDNNNLGHWSAGKIAYDSHNIVDEGDEGVSARDCPFCCTSCPSVDGLQVFSSISVA